MPCNCFGKKNSKELHPDLPYGKGSIQPADEGDLVASKNKHNSLAPDGYLKRESYLNDSQRSKSNTPSTAPALASSPNSSLSVSPSASPRSYRGALLRSELAEKRKEFFRDYFVVDGNSGVIGSSATLPACGRPKSYGDGHPLRPVSQPNSPSSSPLPPPPPGPHLLRPVLPQIKVKTETFASPVFLNELRVASEEISRRWQMSDEERDCTPCSLKGKVKVFPVTYVDRQYYTEGAANFPPVNIDNVDFPELSYNVETPEFDTSTDSTHINYNTNAAEVNIGRESPEIDIIRHPQLISDDIPPSDIDTTPFDISISPGPRDIIVNNEYNSVPEITVAPLDQPFAAVGNDTDSALNSPSEGGHQPQFPSVDARIAEPHESGGPPDHQHEVARTNSPPPALQCNIPLQQKLGRDGVEPATDVVNVSFSSDEVPDNIPQQPWQEEEITPLLDDDEISAQSVLHDTSPSLIDKK